MNQSEKRVFLIQSLLNEQSAFQKQEIPTDSERQKLLLRGLMNIRHPGAAKPEFLQVQDDYLRRETAEKGITDAAGLTPIQPGICLWQGDITTLKCDAIVNAANSGMTGCWVPGHTCIDNCIHTFAGMQLRWECAQLMEQQGHPEGTGLAKITGAYNLPCKHVIHTVGPIAQGRPTPQHRLQLAQCYRSCYELARTSGLHSIAFCCISTGLFGFPQEEAARIAVETVMGLQANDPEPLDVVFNVFLDRDCEIYAELLQ